jgi:hypothetical protein
MTVLRRSNSFLPLFALGGLALTAGCGDGKPSVDTSLTEATVSGVVSVRGVPATGGTIHFNPSNYARIVSTRTATIGPDGTYTIKTYTGDNQVTFGGEVAKKNPGVGLLRDFATVKSGQNEINFDVAQGGKTGGFDITKRVKPKRS